MTFKRKMLVGVCVALMASGGSLESANAQDNVPSRAECEANRVMAEQAASAAASTTVSANKAIVEFGVASGCLFLSSAVAFSDLGMMSGACMALSALATTVSAPDEAAARAKMAYEQYRDPECVKAYGK